MKKGIKRIAVFASGNGSNFQSLLKAQEKRALGGKIVLLVCDNPRAFAINRAQRAKIKVALIERKHFSSKEAFEQSIVSILQKEHISVIALAGFMCLLSAAFVKRYHQKILNVHPALLPAFKGAHGIKDAFDYGVTCTGVTIHFVDEETDHGPIILQSPLAVKQRDTLKTLEARIHKLEHRLYPEAIRLLCAGRLRVRGRRVRVVTSR